MFEYSDLLTYLRISPNIQNLSALYLAIFSLVTEGGSNAILDGFDPGLSELLWVCLQNAAPVGTHKHHLTAVCRSTFPALILSLGSVHAYLVGDTTSKQKRRSMSSQCLTVHSLRSSTTTVGLSWGDVYNMVKDADARFFFFNLKTGNFSHWDNKQKHISEVYSIFRADLPQTQGGGLFAGSQIHISQWSVCRESLDVP